jgi:large subunit ribosomal protein L28
MARVCQLTGKSPSAGKSISHSNRKTNRRFEINIQDKRFWLPSENRFVRLRLSAKGIKTVAKNGIEAVVAKIRKTGQKV